MNNLLNRWPVILAVVVLGLMLIPTGGYDFVHFFHPVGRAVLRGENPYEVHGFYNPPWLLALLGPVALIPAQVARWVWVVMALAGYLVAFRRLGLDRMACALLLVNPFLYFDLGIGNIEWLVLLGATLPPSAAAWLAGLKPQDSVVLFVMWIKQRKWLALVPVAVWGALIAARVCPLPCVESMHWSTDIFPWGVPVGMALAWLAVKREDRTLALAASPFFSPYLAMQSWIFVLLPLARNRRWLAAGVAMSWVSFTVFYMVKFWR